MTDGFSNGDDIVMRCWWWMYMCDNGDRSGPKGQSAAGPSPPALLTSPELGLGSGRGRMGLEGEVVGVRLPSSGTLLYLGGRPG